MKTAFLYAITVLIWGSTWLAIEFQLGDVPVQASVMYRFAIAAACMWGYCLWAKIPLVFSRRNHLFIALLALFNFSFNYSLLYYSQQYLTSAMASIAFSTLLLINIVNTRLFFKTEIQPRVYIGAIFGILGIVALFWHDLNLGSSQSQSLIGLGLALSGTLFASLGNMTSVRNSRAGLNVLAVNAWGMLYGAVFLFVIMLVTDTPFVFSTKFDYIASLLYLAIFGTVIAFASYYILLKDMGAEKASYTIVLFPVIAVILSTFYEDFTWHSSTFIGFAMVLLGNVILLTPFERILNKQSEK